MPFMRSFPVADGQAQVGLWRISESDDMLAGSLRHEELYADSIAGLKAGSRRRREVLAVRCLLRAMTGEEQRVAHDAEGRPSIGAAGNVSISHTDGYAAVVVGRGEMGIDIERLGLRVERVTSRFLQEGELAAADTTTLHLAWSAKETAYKVLGQEYYDLQRLTRVACVQYDTDAMSGRLTLDVERREPMTIHFRVAEDYVLTWYVNTK